MKSPRAFSAYGPTSDEELASEAIVSVSFIPNFPVKEQSFSPKIIGLPACGMPSTQLLSCLRAAFGISNSFKCVGFRTRNANDQLSTFIPLSVASLSPALLSQSVDPVEIMYRYNNHKDSRFSQSESDFLSLEVLLDALEQEKQWNRFDMAVLRAQWAEWKRLDDEKLRASWKELLTDPNVPFSMKKERMRQWLLDPFVSIQAPSVPLQRSSITPLATETQFPQPPESIIARRPSTISLEVLTRNQGMIYQKIVELAHTVFSPKIQSKLLAEADEYHQRISLKEASNAHRNETNDNCSVNDHARKTEQSDISQPMMETLQLDLLNTIDQLVNKHELPEENGLYLIRLVLAKSEVILKVMQLYKKCSNQHDIEDALKQLIHLDSLPKPSVPANQVRSHLLSRPKSIKVEHQNVRSQYTLDNWNDAYKILERLYDQEKLTAMELELLEILIQQQFDPVMIAVETFRTDNNETTFCEQLRVLFHDVTKETKAESKPLFNTCKNGTESIRIEKLHLGPAPLDASKAKSITWWQHLDHLVYQWYYRGMLSQEHHQMIISLLSKKHNLLESAYEVYLSDQDDAELLDTLQRIAKLQLQAYESASCVNFDRLVDEYCSNSISDNECNQLKELFARKHQLTRAAFHQFQSEGQSDEFVSALLGIVRFTCQPETRSRLLQIVGEMLQRQLIRSHEADGLIRLYEEKNDALTAASEVFEIDGDEKELIETLLLVVKHAGLEDPLLCIESKGATTPKANDSDVDSALKKDTVAGVMVKVSESDGALLNETKSVESAKKSNKKSRKKKKKKSGSTEVRSEPIMKSGDREDDRKTSQVFEVNAVKVELEVEVEGEENKLSEDDS
ncbi:unnamed protein product [Albugo candida]|uniref:Uncharacterized protein n=1 Tax=Albugo candida TaxID=65357 RepID=A0A024FUW8_9STRA|nr:unnamed protein product [Albugo candida]|eukprot:CCI10434.1 unnamed protein product [Albugo candida]